MQQAITCRCENRVEIVVEAEYDISIGSPAHQAIRDGSFLSTRCDRCGERVAAEFDFEAIDGCQRRMRFLPESQRNRFMLGTVEISEGQRVLIGFRELAEHVELMRDRLEREPIEFMKYQILRRANSTADVRIYYDGREGSELRFHIHGLKEDEIAVMRLPETIYSRSRTDVDSLRGSEPIRTILEPPYVSIHKIELEPEEGFETVAESVASSNPDAKRHGTHA